MNKILVTEFINKQSLDRLNKVFEVYYDEKLWKNSKKIGKLIKDFDCLILRNKTIVNKSLLDKARKIKFIGRLGVGLDNIDLKNCNLKNIHVQPATGMNAASVAVYVASCSMSLIKKIPSNGICITFDDAVEDCYSLVAPFLFELNIPFSIFVVGL